jgi:thiol-disulfide isomerase/thioredoxin
MSTVILVTLMQVSALGAEQQTFEQAYQRSLTTGRPLVVLIGATWCPGCQTMKHSVMPQVAEAGGLDQVVFFYVDFDRQRNLANRLKRGRAIPQLIRFDQTSTGWKTKCLVGAKRPREVCDFLSVDLPKKATVSKVSTTRKSAKTLRKPASDGTTASEAVTTPSPTRSPTDVPKSGDCKTREDKAHSASARKPGSYYCYWLALRRVFVETWKERR